jgi:hypothetical protein
MVTQLDIHQEYNLRDYPGTALKELRKWVGIVTSLHTDK